LDEAQSVMIFVNNAEDHCNLAKAADACILEVPSCEFQHSTLDFAAVAFS
jgi:hypothetical protein